MKKFLVVAALFASSSLCGAPAVQAGGQVVPPGCLPHPSCPDGRKCAFNSTTDVTREAGWQTGVINAGPLVTGEAGTLDCSIHVNNNIHSGAALVTESASATAGLVVVMAPRTLNYQATAADDVSLCTTWHGASGDLYWVSGNPAVPTDTGHWDTSASSSCGVALSIEPNDPECSIWLAIDQRLGTNIAEIWQDCEGYQPII